ncbi:S26 family signal peptidase [Chitinimonas naiadis]
MNWTVLAFVALVGGPILIWHARRTTAASFDVDGIGEKALWGYFLILIGTWGVLSSVMNPSDVFLPVMLAPACLVFVAKLRGYRAKGNKRPLPAWAAFAYGNALLLALIGLGKTFLVEPMQIPSSSMRPGLVVGDFILVNKLAYGLRLPFLHLPVLGTGKPQRGDVVVFRHPQDTKTTLIKRMIGLPGDKVIYRDKQLIINGQLVTRAAAGTYRYRREQGADGIARQWQEHLAGKSYLTLDEPDKPALDPALLDPALQDSFPFRQHCQYEPAGFQCTIPAGRYLVMGDNRDGSSDSRYWGFVPDDHLAGRAFVVWMSWPALGRVGTLIR